MPFHLTPLNRRQFIRRTLAASAGLLTLPAVRVLAAAADADRWALFSDPHIAADPETIARDNKMAANLREVVAQMRALSSVPAGLIVNGDCAQDHGLAGDYTTFIGLLQPALDIGVPIHLTLGNHDAREVFWETLKDTRPATPPVAGKHVSVVEGKRANWFLLDSLEVTKQTPGSLGDEQRAWLAKALDAHPGKPALVMVHHNPMNPEETKRTGLLDTPELLEVLMPRRQVKAVFYGHTHTWRQSQKDGLHFINLPAIGYPFKAEELTGWVDCKLREDGASLDPRARDPQHPQHGKVVDLTWRAA